MMLKPQRKKHRTCRAVADTRGLAAARSWFSMASVSLLSARLAYTRSSLASLLGLYTSTAVMMPAVRPATTRVATQPMTICVQSVCQALRWLVIMKGRQPAVLRCRAAGLITKPGF